MRKTHILNVYLNIFENSRRGMTYFARLWESIFWTIDWTNL